jgi:hypothetical protein
MTTTCRLCGADASKDPVILKRVNETGVSGHLAVLAGVWLGGALRRSSSDRCRRGRHAIHHHHRSARMIVDWKAAVAAFDSGLFPLRLSFAVIGPDWAPRVQASLTVISVRTGLPTILLQTNHPPPELPDDEDAAEYLFNVGLSLIEHELAEQCRFRGRRIYEPEHDQEAA